MDTKTVLAAFSLACATWALAQPGAPDAKSATAAKCADCGTVTNVRPLSTELRPRPSDEGEPSGLVATVPLGGGSMRAGSSSRIGKDAPSLSTRWEVVVRFDDGRYTVVTQDAEPPFAKGERVRVHEGKLERAPEK